MRIITVFIILSCSVLGLIAISLLPNLGAAADQEVLVTKVIDGDTLVVEGGDHVRLLGMDSDEKGYPCFDAARLGLEGLVLNKWVTLESDGADKDQYGRLLRWVWLNDTLVNFELVHSGLAVTRFYSDSVYKANLVAAEKDAIANKVGCKWSSLK